MQVSTNNYYKYKSKYGSFNLVSNFSDRYLKKNKKKTVTHPAVAVWLGNVCMKFFLRDTDWHCDLQQQLN